MVVAAVNPLDEKDEVLVGHLLADEVGTRLEMVVVIFLLSVLVYVKPEVVT